MRAVWSGDIEESELDLIHDEVRSSIRLHSQVHWVDLRIRWRKGERSELLQDLPPAALAPVASLGRRLAGLDAGMPPGRNLWSTWRQVIHIALQTG